MPVVPSKALDKRVRLTSNSVMPTPAFLNQQYSGNNVPRLDTIIPAGVDSSGG